MLRNTYLSFADFVSHRLSNSLHRLLKIPHQNHSQKETLDHMTSNQHFHRGEPFFRQSSPKRSSVVGALSAPLFFFFFAQVDNVNFFAGLKDSPLKSQRIVDGAQVLSNV